MTDRPYIAVVGAAEASEKELSLAERVGDELARRGAVLVCGGRTGVMEAAARGASRRGGLVVGILPGETRAEGNPYLTVAVATGMGNARNAVIVKTADAVIAVGGGYGTLSEIGLALNVGRPVVGLETWRVERAGRPGPDPGVRVATSPDEAVSLALRLAGSSSGSSP
ncbi:MAG: TIGR00725 family protein [Firmicutes bacterium]|nr:TIGR00725 family protein [Bacillota bacterium]